MRLMEEGCSVALLLRTSSKTLLIKDVVEQSTVILGDMNDLEAVREQIAAHAPEIIVHIAWQGVNGVNRNSSIQLDNVLTTLQLYQIGRDLGIKKFVGLGSQAEYGPQSGRINESTPPHPTTIYGAAKLATYLLLDRLSAVDGIDFAWLRLFSGYGPGDDPRCLIPYLISSLLKREAPNLTRCEQIWDFIYVDDVAAAIVAAAHGNAKGVFNLGSGIPLPLKEVVERLRDVIDPSIPIKFGDVPYRPDQVMHLEADISALVSATGWRPSISLEDGLRFTVDWHRNLATKTQR